MRSQTSSSLVVLFRSVWVVAVIMVSSTCYCNYEAARSCQVFCYGPILETVQKMKLFNDSKDFVDMPLVRDPEATLAAFETLGENKTDEETVRAFVYQHFTDPGTELEECEQSDWVQYPETFKRIKDVVYRNWAYKIHELWKTLCRKMKQDVLLNPQRYSLLPVPHPFVAPGGRFRELYYWDTYWIVKGLLASGMYNSSKLMILNLAQLVQDYGFVPNGARAYYLTRSQPPLLSGMVYDYFKATNDTTFVKYMLPILEKELGFWRANRLVKWETDSGEKLDFYQYRVATQVPRPESYKEDIDTASWERTLEGKRRIWRDIAAGAESGWDFSTRWFMRGTNTPYSNNLRSIRTSRIVPVDLNSFMCWNDAILAELYTALGNHSQADSHQSRHEYMRYAMHRAFWNAEHGSWFDLDLDGKRQIQDYFVSNPTPLFAGCAHSAKDVHKRVLAYLKTSGGYYPGGLATSAIWSDEQWDKPNGWAPTNHIVIEGLCKSDDPQVREAAFQLANNWVQANYVAYVRNGRKMFEKYNVENLHSQAGGGGEYKVQEGFGWTNGVILDLLIKYGDMLTPPPVPPPEDMLAENIM